jgi:hypothetical protein
VGLSGGTAKNFISIERYIWRVGDVSVEVWYYQRTGSSVLVFVVGPPGGNDAYIPTIDGAYRCGNFNWSSGTCGGSWGFISASSAGLILFPADTSPAPVTEGVSRNHETY